MKKYSCNICGYVYDPVAGDPEHGIAPGEAPRRLDLSSMRSKQI